jgi:hypothetical protein
MSCPCFRCACERRAARRGAIVAWAAWTGFVAAVVGLMAVWP